MAFAYFNRLTIAQKRTYRRSDQITAIPLPKNEELHALTRELAVALGTEDHELTQRYSQRLFSAITDRLNTPRVRVEVLQVRPSNHIGELQGLYIPEEHSKAANVKLCMRMAKRKQVVAFRTFLRTLLHELCHHLDYELLILRDSFHTQRFYKRESNLLHQLLEERPSTPARTVKVTQRPGRYE